MMLETLYDVGDIVLFMDDSCYEQGKRIFNQPVDDVVQTGIIESYGFDSNGFKCVIKLFPLTRDSFCSIVGTKATTEDKIIEKLGSINKTEWAMKNRKVGA